MMSTWAKSNGLNLCCRGTRKHMGHWERKTVRGPIHSPLGCTAKASKSLLTAVHVATTHASPTSASASTRGGTQDRD